MPDDAVLNYATPRRDGRTQRPDWLAVFSFLWTFGVSLPAALWIMLAVDRAGPLHLGVLVLTPAVAAACAYAATERGAAWDSGYRWTGFAVWAAPFATVMTSAGLLFCILQPAAAPM